MKRPKKITMKRVLIGAAWIICFSCSDEQKMKQILEQEIKTVAKDPDSYKFVQMKIDTIRKSEIAKLHYDGRQRIALRESYEKLKKAIDDSVRHLKEFRHNHFGSSDHSLINGYRMEITHAKELIIEKTSDSIKYSPFINDQSVIGFIVQHECRLRNGFGGYEIEVSHASFDKDLNFIRLIFEEENNKYEWIALYNDFEKLLK